MEKRSSETSLKQFGEKFVNAIGVGAILLIATGIIVSFMNWRIEQELAAQEIRTTDMISKLLKEQIQLLESGHLFESNQIDYKIESLRELLEEGNNGK